MDANSLALIKRLISMGSTSLLQYVSESSPWSKERSHADTDKVIALAKEERDEASRLTRALQKRRVYSRASETYPSHFTTVNFVTIQYLLPKLIAEHEKTIIEIETALHRVADSDAGKLAAAYLEMKRKHLQVLHELASPGTSSRPNGGMGRETLPYLDLDGHRQ